MISYDIDNFLINLVGVSLIREELARVRTNRVQPLNISIQKGIFSLDPILDQLLKLLELNLHYDVVDFFLVLVRRRHLEVRDARGGILVIVWLLKLLLC